MDKITKQFNGEPVAFAYDVDSNVGGEEWDVVAKWCIKNTTPNDVYIEIGAQIGYMASLVCKFARPKLAILIEPDPRTIPLLEENLRTHANCEYIILPRLVLDKIGEHEFYLDQANPAVNSIYQRQGHKIERAEIATSTIDSIVEEFKITSPIVMKIDAEFSEHLIWEGMQKSIPLIKAAVMEFHKPGLQELAKIDPYHFFNLMAEKFNVSDLNHNNIILKKK